MQVNTAEAVHHLVEHVRHVMVTLSTDGPSAPDTDVHAAPAGSSQLQEKEVMHGVVR